jgi:hypothetical protein
MLEAFGTRTEVRTVATPVRPTRAPVLVSLVALLAIAGSACTPATGQLGTPSTPAPSADASVEIPSTDATPGTPAPSDSATPTPSGPASPSKAPATTTPTATPTTAPSTSATIVVRAYFYLGSFTGSGGLVPVLREVPKTQAVGGAALRALIAGPSAKELAATPAMYTDIPDGTRLLGLSIANGVATVNLSSEFQVSTGSGKPALRLAQVAYTLTQFSTVTSVLFQVEGVAMTGSTVTRDSYQAELPNIFVDRPAWGAAAGNPVKIQGVANVFEATFRVQIKDAKGGTLVDRQVMASCGTGCWGDFSVSIAYNVSKAQWGTLRVFDLSARDGSAQDVTEYPVWLTPAG